MGQTTPDHEHLARFLLHQLPAGESDAIRERLFEDEALLEEMEAVERDLLDAYASGGLSDADRRAVDVHLMNSDVQREKLRFAFALGQRRPVRTRARPMLWAAAAVVLMALVGSAVWIARLAGESQRLRAEAATLRQESARAEDAPAVAFLLSPVDRSTEELRLEVGPGVALVRLNLALEAAAESISDVRVRTAAGALVLEQHGVAVQSTAGATYLSIWLPSAALPSGSYSISVSQGNGGELNYAFRLIHHK